MWEPTRAGDRRPGAYGFWDDFERAIEEARRSLQEGGSATYQLFASSAWFDFHDKSYGSGPAAYIARGISFGSVFGLSTFELETALGGAFGHRVTDSAERFLEEIIEQIKNAASWETLAAIARPIIGPYSLAAGILLGLGESLGKDVSSLLGLAKMVVLAGLYERIKHPALLSFSDPLTLTLALATSRFRTLRREAEKADELLRKTLEELKEIAKHPIKFIEIVGQSAWKGVQKDWNDLKYYAANPSISNDFRGGRILGRALYQIIMMILLVMSVAGVAVKLAARFPWLMRLARIISRGGKLEELEELEQGVRGAQEAEDAANARKDLRQKPRERNPSTDRKAVGEWSDSFPKRPAVGQGPAHDFQVRSCGPTETQVSGGGQQIWVDGIDDATGTLQEAKYVGTPERSPFVDDSSIDPEIRQFIRSKTEDEFQRYAAVINDPATPVSNLEVITNDSRAVPYFQSVLDKFNIPGSVTVVK